VAYEIGGNDTVTPGLGGSDSPDAPEGGRARLLDWRLWLPLVLILVVVGGTALALSGSTKSQPLPNNVHQAKKVGYDGLVATPAVPAPPLALDSYLGQPINIDDYRGKAVLVTFLYANCPTLCPLIAANLHTAQAMLPHAETAKVQIIAVSVDPRGDTPKAVAAFLRHHEMTGRMQYLIGNAAQLSRVWAAWNVGSTRDTQQPDLVNHSGLVYGISASGKLTTLYPANFTPSEIVHDVPALLAS